MPHIRITTSDAKREAEGSGLAETLISSNGLGYPDSTKIVARISKSVVAISQSPMKSPDELFGMHLLARRDLSRS